MYTPGNNNTDLQLLVVLVVEGETGGGHIDVIRQGQHHCRVAALDLDKKLINRGSENQKIC